VRFFLDENLSVVSLAPLKVIFGNRHSFEHAGSLDLLGVDDIDLYPRVKAAGVDAIISKDGRQLTNQVERRGLYDNRLTFIHLHMGKAKGAKALALELASITAGLPYVEEAWLPEPWVFRLKGLQSGFTERVSSSVPIWMDSWGSKPS
jgi:PIN like domain